MIDGIEVRAWRVLDYMHVVLRVRHAASPDRVSYTYVVADVKPTDLQHDTTLVSELGHLCHLIVAATSTERMRQARGSQVTSRHPLVLRWE